jgi:hypothetical protein
VTSFLTCCFCLDLSLLFGCFPFNFMQSLFCFRKIDPKITYICLVYLWC